MSGGAQLQGADQLVRTLSAASDALDALDQTAGAAAGTLLTEDARAASPRKTGRMAQAHGYTVTEGTVTVTVATPYAAAVNALIPWLDDTASNDEAAVVELYSAGVDNAVALVEGT